MALQRDADPWILLLLGVIALLTLFYSVFIARAILQWVGIVVPLVFLYLAWRFVRAHERLAAAVESSGLSAPIERPEEEH